MNIDELIEILSQPFSIKFLADSKLFIPPPTVPGFTVTFSLNLLLLPISKYDFSLLYLRSWGWAPIEEKGKKELLKLVMIILKMNLI